MTTLAQRLAEAMAETGVTAADLVRATGAKAPSVHKWVHGLTKNIRGANLVAAARLLRVNEAWLADGKGPKSRSESTIGWPFPDISPEDYARLSEADREDIHALVRLKVSRLSKRDSAKAA
ncbi:helix-turn-helix domain-containing protein [Bordetella avium]|uniref:Phage repressor n=1 Tax=Bordetella avium (strain 197N) TaxID=360910 RepID=Q2L2H0_BORA1|nr:transcriptional regulator [Bordetella avium]AZY52214.1 transcriptional regulator [Bordetella avium]RIQ54485.1 transcriptional regulator [Bordetella avium]RIQ71018.1 transcriptional regulator [Bordetella avium]CAJ49047.1 Putative phage repressor [Bordetella avium 197N]